MKCKVPRPGQLAQLNALWDQMDMAKDDLFKAFSGGSVEEVDFRRLWSEYKAARERYEALQEEIPVIDLPPA